MVLDFKPMLLGEVCHGGAGLNPINSLGIRRYQPPPRARKQPLQSRDQYAHHKSPKLFSYLCPWAERQPKAAMH